MPGPMLPYRGIFGEARPAALADLPLPPAPMPPRRGLRPLKAWRYVGIYGPELMICAARVRVGPARQSFWAVWDRVERRLYERTAVGSSAVVLAPGRLRIEDRVRLDVSLQETAGVESVCPSGDHYAWTRKQGDIRVTGRIEVEGAPARAIAARAVIDDTAAYYERHTSWSWSAGVGSARDGRSVAWNLVSGVNDPPSDSERTIWIEGRPVEAPPVEFAPDLSSVGALRFSTEAVRDRRESLLLVRSRYRQPFGIFEGELPGGIELAEGYGVMEDHDAWW